MLLQEIPGAIERPAGCNIRVTQEQESSAVVIPPRRPLWFDFIIPALYTAGLVIWVIVGVVLFTQHKIIILTDTNHDHGHVSRFLVRYLYWLLPVWIGMLAIGIGTLFTVLRAYLLTETLRFDRLGVTVSRRTPFSHNQEIVLRENLRGFLVRRDPQGMWGSRLTLQSIGPRIEVAEYAREAEREWLASVGNALIGRY